VPRPVETSKLGTGAKPNEPIERHPISAQIILTRLEAARGTLYGLRPDELFPHDQDHYGGTAANDALAKCAHIGPGTMPDLARALSEAHRVLRPGGRIAFTDWIAHQPLSAADEQLLWDGMAAATLINIDRHAELLRGAGFAIESVEDETDRWSIILAERLRMYQKLRGEAEQAGTAAGHDDFYKSYVLFVSLVQRKIMGGARFAAVKPA
jgi:SAM-dependent methyltransferase